LNPETMYSFIYLSINSLIINLLIYCIKWWERRKREWNKTNIHRV